MADISSTNDAIVESTGTCVLNEKSLYRWPNARTRLPQKTVVREMGKVQMYYYTLICLEAGWSDDGRLRLAAVTFLIVV